MPGSLTYNAAMPLVASVALNVTYALLEVVPLTPSPEAVMIAATGAMLSNVIVSVVPIFPATSTA